MAERRGSWHNPAGRDLISPFCGGVWVHEGVQGDGDATVRLFWHPDYDPSVLAVHAEPVPPSDQGSFDIASFSDMTDLVRDGHGHEFLLLDDGAHQIELEIKSGTLSRGPVRLRCELEMVAGIESKLLTISRLNAFRRLKSFPKNLFPPERRAAKWAMALQAYDGMLAGASLKDIAIVLFGEKWVREEWNGRSAFLKSRVQRLLHYGRKMVDGDYKTLLK